MTRQHRYRQEALEHVSGAEPRDYSPRQQELAPPQQQTLALDGGPPIHPDNMLDHYDLSPYAD